MLVYNITMQIDPAIEAAWVRWQQEEHIPAILQTGLFTDHKFYRLIEPIHDDNLTFVVQYYILTKEHYQTYLRNFAPALQQAAIDKWGNQFTSFRTVMEVVN